MAQVTPFYHYQQKDGIVQSLHYLLNEANSTGNVVLVKAISLAIAIVEGSSVSIQDKSMLPCAEFLIKMVQAPETERQRVFEVLASMELNDAADL